MTYMTPTDPSPSTWHAGVLLFDGFEPLDAIGPAQVLWTVPQALRASATDGPEVQVHLVGPSTEPVTANYGMVVQPTVSYDDCPPLDLLVVPGGGRERSLSERRGVRFYRTHEPTLDLLRREADRGALVTSVCTGSFILAGAGLLADRRATTHWSARAALVELMAERGERFELVEERVVDDGAVVTGGGVSSGIDMALHVTRRTFGDQIGDVVALIVEKETPAATPQPATS